MATLSQTPVAPDQSGAPSRPEGTIRRLTLYFQSWGLPEQKATEAAEAIVRSATQELDGSGDDLLNASVERSLKAVGDWLDEIAKADPRSSAELRLQLAWFLRPVLIRHPDAFLHGNDLHEEFRQAVRAAGRPILPPSSPTAMPPQPLGELPRLWYRLVGYGDLLWERLAAALQQRRAEP